MVIWINPRGKYSQVFSIQHFSFGYPTHRLCGHLASHLQAGFYHLEHNSWDSSLGLETGPWDLSSKQYTCTFFSETSPCLFLQVAKYAGLYTTKYLSAYLKLGSVAVEKHQKAIQQWSSLHDLKSICAQLTKPPRNLHHCVNMEGVLWVSEQFYGSSTGGDADTIFRAKMLQTDNPADMRESAGSTQGARHEDGTSFYCPPWPWGLTAWLSTALGEEKREEKSIYVLLQNFMISLMT